jgi:Flp pilus assembly protein TadB
MAEHNAELTVEEARRRLDDVDRARRAVQSGERRWWFAYLGSAGLAILVLFPLIGLLPAGPGASAFVTAWSTAIGMIVSYSARKRLVRRRGQAMRHALVWGTWAVVYGTALALGVGFFRGRPAYWIPMAVVVSAPLLAGAWWAARA